MAVYTNLKCGNCGKSISGGFSRGRVSVLGVTHIQCTAENCKAWNLTDSCPYSKFGLYEKFMFHGGIILRGFYIGGITGAMSLGFIPIFNVIINMIIGLILGWFIYYKISRVILKPEIELIEQRQIVLNERMKIK